MQRAPSHDFFRAQDSRTTTTSCASPLERADCGLRFRTQTATEIIHGRAARLKRVRAQRRGTPPAHAERPPTRQVPAGAMQAEIGLAKNLKGKRVCQGVPQLEAPAAPSGTDCGWTLAAARRQA